MLMRRPQTLISMASLVALGLGAGALALPAVALAQTPYFVDDEAALSEPALLESDHARSAPGMATFRTEPLTLVAWSDERPFDPILSGGIYASIPPDRYGIYATLLDETGTPSTPAGRLIVRNLKSPVQPWVTGGFNVAYLFWPEAKIRMTRVGSSGVALADSPTDVSDEHGYRPRADCGSYCYVAWFEREYVGFDSVDSIRLANFNSSSTTAFTLPTPPEGISQSDPVVAANDTSLTSARRAQLVYREVGGDAPGIYARNINRSSFYVEDPPRLLHPGLIREDTLAIAESGGTGYLVIWTQASSSYDELWGLFLDAEGLPIGVPEVLHSVNASITDPRVVAADTGYHLAWSRSPATSTASTRYAFVRPGEPLSEPLLVRHGQPASIANGPEESFIASWFSPRSNEPFGNVYSQIISGPDAKPYNAEKDLLSGIAAGQQRVAGIAAGEGEYLVGYSAREGDDNFYYAQVVSAQGDARGARINLPGMSGVTFLEGRKFFFHYLQDIGADEAQLMGGWIDLSVEPARIETFALLDGASSSLWVESTAQELPGEEKRILVVSGVGSAWVSESGVELLELRVPAPRDIVAGKRSFLAASNRGYGSTRKTDIRLISSGGEAVGEPVQVASEELFGYQASTSIAFNGEEYLVVFAGSNTGISTRPRGVLVTEDGELGEPFDISPNAPGDDWQGLDVTWDGTNFVVVWEGLWQGLGNTDLTYVARVSPEGELVDTDAIRAEFPREIAPQTVLTPKVASVEQGQSLFVYTRDDWLQGGQFLLKGRFLLDPRADGQPCFVADDCSTGLCVGGTCGPLSPDSQPGDHPAQEGAGGAGGANSHGAENPLSNGLCNGGPCVLLIEQHSGCGCRTSRGRPHGGLVWGAFASLGFALARRRRRGLKAWRRELQLPEL